MKRIGFVLTVVSIFLLFLASSQGFNDGFKVVYKEPNSAIQEIADDNTIELPSSSDTNELVTSFLNSVNKENSEKLVSELIESIDPVSIQKFTDGLSDENLNDIVKNLNSGATDWLLEFQEEEGAKKLGERLEPEQIERVSKFRAPYIPKIGDKEASVTKNYKAFIAGATKLDGFFLDPGFEGTFEYTADGIKSLDKDKNIVTGPGLKIFNEHGAETINIPLNSLKGDAIFFLKDGIIHGKLKSEGPIEHKEGGGSANSPDELIAYDYKGNAVDVFVGTRVLEGHQGYQIIQKDTNEYEFYTGNNLHDVIYFEPKKEISFSNFGKNGNLNLAGRSQESPIIFSQHQLYAKRNNPGVTVQGRIEVFDTSLPKIQLSDTRTTVSSFVKDVIRR